MTMNPKGARPNCWQSLHMVCKYCNNHKPVYPLRSLAKATERGHRAKMRLTSFEVLGIMLGMRLFVRCCAVAVRTLKPLPAR